MRVVTPSQHKAVGYVTGTIDQPEMLHKVAVSKANTDFTTLGHLFVIGGE